MRVVLDTNIWISALLNPSGPPGRLVNAVATHQLEAVVTPHLWREVLDTFSKDRIQARLKQQDRLEEASLFLFGIRSRLTKVQEIAPTQSWISSDSDDDWVIQCALTAEVSFIVTGDRALLALEHVNDTTIVDAQSFCQQNRIE